MDLTEKAKSELKNILNTNYGLEFNDEELNTIGIFLLTILAETIKHKVS